MNNGIYNVELESELELAALMLESAENCKEGEVVSCIGYYSTIKKLTTALILIGDGEIELVETDLYEELSDTYGNEFILTIDEYGIWIMPLYSGRECIYESNYLYIDNNCNSKILSYNECNNVNIYAFEISTCGGNCAACNYYEADEFNYDDIDLSDNKDLSCDEEDPQHGFTVTKNTTNGYYSYSFYSTDPVLVEKQRKEWAEKF